MSRFTVWALIAVVSLALLGAACTAASSTPAPGSSRTPPPQATATATATATADPAPQPGATDTPTADGGSGAGGTVSPESPRGAGVFVDTTDVLLLESYPVQVVLHVTGNLPTPCHALAHSVVDDGARIDVTLTASSSAQSCAQVLHPFDERIALGSYPSGARSVWLNGERVGDFDLGPAPAPTPAVAPGVPFTLRAGASATMADDGMVIRFDAVEHDSRCPRDVQCIRAGDATVLLTVTPSGGATTAVRVLVDPREGAATVNGRRLRVTQLSPTPVSTSPIQPGDYVATLVIER